MPPCRSLAFVAALLVLLLPPLSSGHAADELQPSFLALQPPLQQPEAEISGLAWHGERLVLLPQFPDFSAPSAVYAIQKDALLSRLRGEDRSPLPHEVVAVRGLAACTALPGWEGFEAIAVQGDLAWLLIEANDGGRMRSWLIQGRFAPDGKSLSLDASSLSELSLPAQLQNMSYESLALGDGLLLALYEANGANVTPAPYALAFDPAAPLPQTPERISFPHVEYRITDASAVQEHGGRRSFLALNFFWPGERRLLDPAPDPIAERWGEGRSHARSEAVERILRFEITPSGIRLADAAPLQLSQGFVPRNWEGLAHLAQGSDTWLLLATDKYPGSLLGHVLVP